jgi:hypothetical protein
MATRSRIGIELKDGSILSAYHHWDGYPEWLGRILTTHYNDREAAAELIDGGDMSTCWTKDDYENEYHPEYYSARGENCPPRLNANLHEYLTQDAEEYAYVYTQEEGWLCYDTCEWHESYLEAQEIPSGALAV